MEWNTSWDLDTVFSFGSKQPPQNPKKMPFYMDDEEMVSLTPSTEAPIHNLNFSLFTSEQPDQASSSSYLGLQLGNSATVSQPSSSTAAPNRTKNDPTPRCVVDECNADLSSAKEYYRKHKVCEEHSKCSKVMVDGISLRFCQQCSRFHGLPEFDREKRSCRRRLHHHNARRRKPQQEMVQMQQKPFYGGMEGQMGFILSQNCSQFQQYPAQNSHISGYCMQPDTASSSFINFDQMEAPPDHGRALSLLSPDGWGSCGGEEQSVTPSVAATELNVMYGIGEHGSLGREFLFPSTTQPHAHQATTPYELQFYPYGFH